MGSGLGNAVSYSSLVWSGTTAEIEFGALKYDIRWHHFGPTVAGTYAKPLVHNWPRTTYVLNCQNCVGINVRTCPLLRP